MTMSPHAGMSQEQSAHLADGVSDIVATESRATTQEKRVVQVAKDGDRDFIATYFPFTLPDNLHPALEEDLVVLWLVHAILGWAAGPLWIPSAIAKVDTGDDYQTEAIINWLIHTIPLVANAIAYVPIVGWAIFVLNCVQYFYLYPVATFSQVTYHATGGGGGKRKRKKSALKDLPGMPSFAQANVPAAGHAY